MDDVKVRFVESMSDVEDFHRWLGQSRELMVFDCETSGLDWWAGQLRLAQLGDADGGWAFDWNRWSGAVIEALQTYRGPLAGHNIKFDAHWYQRFGGHELNWSQIDDTMPMARVLNPNAPAGLKNLAVKYVDKRAAVGEQRLKQTFGERGWDWGTVPVDCPDYWAYGALDTVINARLFPELRRMLHAEPGLWDIYQMEMPVEAISYRMERKGCRIDRAYCVSEGQKLLAEASQLVKHAKGLGLPNVGSNKDLAAWFQSQGEVLTEKTEHGDWKMDKEVLGYISLQGVTDLVRIMAVIAGRVRRNRKVANTYLLKFDKMADSDDILHASINPLAAKTGRQSVSEPSLQNLIRGAQVRDAFIPREGNVLIMADFDQIEVRLLAHFCGDPTLMAAINSEDIHTTTARLIYQDPTMVKSDPRRMPTKNATYARIYGAGVAKFAITAGISLEQARFVMNGYDDAYPGVPNFIGQVIATARDRSATDGSPWVRTPSGRRLIGDRGDEYKLVNYLIQGTAADVMKRQTIQCANAGLEPYMLMTVHDELLFDVPKEDVVDVVQTIMEVMPDMTGYKVPLTIGVEVHDRWGSKYRK